MYEHLNICDAKMQESLEKRQSDLPLNHSYSFGRHSLITGDVYLYEMAALQELYVHCLFVD
jgi:hypothetical protein